MINKQGIIELLTKNHDSFISYIAGLTAEDYAYSHQQKWTAGQQLEHIVLCVKPLEQVFKMEQSAIAQTFGLPDKPGSSYEALLAAYLEKLKAGGSAPARYVPETGEVDQRPQLSESLRNMVSELCSLIDRFEEQDLDRLCIPHPLLGNLSLREMLYNAIYHVTHHHAMAQRHLESRKVKEAL